MTGTAYFLLGVLVTMLVYGAVCWAYYEPGAWADDDTENGVGK